MQKVRTLPTQHQLFGANLARVHPRRPHSGTVAHRGETIALTWRCSQNRTIEAGSARSTQRELVMVAALDDVPIATVEASAFRMKGASGDEFVDACDSVCANLCQMAEVASRHWYLEDLAANEELVVFERIVIHPDYAGMGRMTAILSHAIDVLSPDPEIVLLNAFPLEHEHIDPPVEPDFSTAQARLIAYYAKALGVMPLPSSSGEEGWLYKSKYPPEDRTDAL